MPCQGKKWYMQQCSTVLQICGNLFGCPVEKIATVALLFLMIAEHKKDKVKVSRFPLLFRTNHQSSIGNIGRGIFFHVNRFKSIAACPNASTSIISLAKGL